MKMMIKKTALSILLTAIFLLLTQTKTKADRPRPFGFRLGTGYLWAQEDKKDLDGQSLYSQHYPFIVEFSYGCAIKGVIGLDHVFSQEKEHVELDSLDEQVRFTPKMRQYIFNFGILANWPVSPRVLVYAGMGAALFWRAYNPGWKDKSYWDKTRLGGTGQMGLDVKLGPKAWFGVGWRGYAVGWCPENRWTKGEFNRLRRMDVFSLTISYFP